LVFDAEFGQKAEALKLIGLELWRFFYRIYLGLFPDKIILRFHMEI
jgi:hypothetical protein